MLRYSKVALLLDCIRLRAWAMTVMPASSVPTELPAFPIPLISASIRSGSPPNPVASARDMAVRSSYSMGVLAAKALSSDR